MTTIFNPSARNAYSGTTYLPAPVNVLPVGSLKLYDKDARFMGATSTAAPSQAYHSILQPSAPGYSDYTMIQAVVKKTAGSHLLIEELLKQDTLLAVGFEKGIVLQRCPNGDFNFYCMVLRLQDRIKVTGMAPNGDEAVRSFLKGCYAGWHHVFHEVFATASGFRAVPVCNTSIDELLIQIQSPQRFPA